MYGSCGFNANLLSWETSGDLSIGKPPSELEVMMTIAHTYGFQAAGSKDLKKAIGQAAASCPPCKPYIKTIGDFVASYAGGEDFKLLKYLDLIGFSIAFTSLLHTAISNFQPLQAFNHSTITYRPVQAWPYRPMMTSENTLQPVQAH